MKGSHNSQNEVNNYKTEIKKRHQVHVRGKPAAADKNSQNQVKSSDACTEKERCPLNDPVEGKLINHHNQKQSGHKTGVIPELCIGSSNKKGSICFCKRNAVRNTADAKQTKFQIDCLIIGKIKNVCHDQGEQKKYHRNQ